MWNIDTADRTRYVPTKGYDQACVALLSVRPCKVTLKDTVSYFSYVLMVEVDVEHGPVEHGSISSSASHIN